MADTPLYVPNAPSSIKDEHARAVADWAYRELLKLSQSLAQGKAIDLQPTYTAPVRPREGMIVHADGTKWDPGSGAGSYSYTAGGWKPLTLNGTVVSVALSLPGIFSVSGSPITVSGTLTATLATQAANLVWAGPSSGADAAPTFRAVVEADLSLTDITTNNVSTTKHGFVPKAPNDATKCLDGTGAYSSKGAFTSSYTSAQTTYANGGNLTFTHGLGAAPALVQLQFVCQVAEGNYSIGDVVEAANSVAITITSTTVYLSFSSSGLGNVNKTTGVVFTMTVANWKVVVKAWV